VRLKARPQRLREQKMRIADKVTGASVGVQIDDARRRRIAGLGAGYDSLS